MIVFFIVTGIKWLNKEGAEGRMQQNTNHKSTKQYVQ